MRKPGRVPSVALPVMDFPVLGTSLTNSVCTVTVTNPATGAFPVTSATGTASGTFNFLTGTVAGTYNFTSPTASSGTLVGQRR